MPTSRRGPRINHLFFADDSLLFCRANHEHWNRLTSILHIYEKGSGQQLNKEKTGLFFSRNTPPEIRQKIMEVAGIPSTQRYDLYLGLPALVGKSRIAAFRGIKDKVWKRLQDWKLNFLSQAGKEILLKAVIQAIPSYSMSVFLLPKALCLEINSLMQKFWWGNQKKNSSIHWMSWSRMGLPKSRGGMGFRDLHSFNKALLAKQCWRLWKEEDSITAKIMKCKYYPRGSILEAQLGNKPSFIWRSILSSRSLIQDGLVWRIGDGSLVHIWGDKWLPSPSTYSIQSPPKSIAPDAMVSELIDQDLGAWKLSLLKELFSNEEVSAILSIPISHTKQPDRQIWRGTMKGNFTVGSAYHMAKEKEDAKLAGSSQRAEVSKIWKGIWSANMPNAVKTFMWRACHNLLPTKENLVKRKVISDPSCPICGLETETTSHILWECISASDVWGVSKRFFQKKSCSNPDFRQLAEDMFFDGSEEMFEIFSVIARLIWVRRNEWIHEGTFTHPNVIALRGQQNLDDYHSIMQKGPADEAQSAEESPWKPPEAGWMKLNSDAALDERGRRIGVGGILRDEQGSVRAAWSLSKHGLLDPTAAEATALFHGVLRCKSLGISNLFIESDSLVVISAIQDQGASNSRFGHLIDDIREVLRCFPRWKAGHVKRSSNRAAHGLAKAAFHQVLDCNWDFTIPGCVCDTVLAEQIVAV
jgi:ribonuclease HI